MKKLFPELSFAVLCATLLAACGGDGGSSADSLDESSSSSEMDGAESSDSEGLNSNGSEGVEGSSASVPSGSSDTNLSGGSLIVANQCKIETEDNCEYGSLTDSRDGQTYRTVKIGGQVWMAENLNFVMDNSWCYNDESDNCDTYGRLYNWAAAVGRDDAECGYGYECELGTGDIRGVCPKGWHLPSQSEWEALIVAVDGSITEYTSSNTAGTKLKSTTGWDAHRGITNEDAFGFSALPAGYRGNYGGYSLKGYYADFWSSTEDGSDYAYGMYLGYGGVYAGLDDVDKDGGYSVRCLKDYSDSGNSKTIAEICADGLSEDCLVGTWTLKSISQIGNKEIITDFSTSQGGIMEFREDGIYHYTRSSYGDCPDPDEGHWIIEDKTLTFKEDRKGDCIEFGKKYTVTPSIIVAGETVFLYLNKVIFLQNESDGMFGGNDTEVFVRTE
ncbi:MAG: lipocalin family protein [Fibrobacter sp.]|nr:lipocalin family protein [Fibrobacter sp.]